MSQLYLSSFSLRKSFLSTPGPLGKRRREQEWSRTRSACHSVAEALRKSPDVPFALLYVEDPSGGRLVLKSCMGLPEGVPRLSPLEIVVEEQCPSAPASVWPVPELLRDGRPLTVDLENLPELPTDLKRRKVKDAVCLPLRSASAKSPLGILIAGRGPSRGREEESRSFYEMIADQIAIAIHNARLAEEERRRAETLLEVAKTREQASRRSEESERRIRVELVEAKEIAEKANIAKSRFLANMSHEIRTPVTALTGFAQLLRREGLTTEEKESYLAIIERNSEQLMRLIDDILDLSKVESGKMTFEKTAVSLRSLLLDLQSLVEVRSRGLNIRFSVFFRGRVPETFQADAIRLKQILTNLIGNAVKFTREGRVDLTVSAQDGFLHFEIRDEGPGIEPARAETLFCPFVQADSSICRKFGGAGLGLALSRGLARSMGGEVGLLESEPGKGSRFEARVPLEEAISFQAMGSSSREESPGAGWGTYVGRLVGRKVLLVEDTADSRTLIKAYLEETGASVRTAQDGIEGVELALRETFDIALMDIQMPRRDGYEATRILRDEGCRFPIVALTAHAMSDEQDRCLKAGCTVHLPKPVDREQLIETIVTLIEPRVLH